MMALTSIITYRFLKGEVLLPAKEKKVADWRISIRTMKNCAPSDAQTAFQSDWIGGIASALYQRPQEVVFASAAPDVQKSTRARRAAYREPPSISPRLMARQKRF